MSDNLPKTKTVWLLFDVDNGHEPSKHYCWWFNTRKHARQHKQWQKRNQGAKLVGPVKAKCESHKTFLKS